MYKALLIVYRALLSVDKALLGQVCVDMYVWQELDDT